MECVIEFLWLECVAWNFQSSLSSDRGSSRVEGIIRVWIAIIVSQINFIFVQALFQIVELLVHTCGVATEPVNQIYLAEYLFLVNWVAAAA